MANKLNIADVVVTQLAQNCRILFQEGSRVAVIIDPGGDVRKILALLKKLDVSLKEIWLTHSHLDHCGGVKALIDKTGATLFGHPNEQVLRGHVKEVENMYGFEPELDDCPEPDVYIEGGETLLLGDHSFQVLFTPGHSSGHLCFYNREAELVLAGDTLFKGTIGRTDIPGGNTKLLLKSIKEELLVLPPSTLVLPGHGPNTTIGAEIQSNPFLREIRV